MVAMFAKTRHPVQAEVGLGQTGTVKSLTAGALAWVLVTLPAWAMAPSGWEKNAARLDTATMHLDPVAVRQVVSRGPLEAVTDLGVLGSSCVGYGGASAPDAILQLPRTTARLSLYVESDADTTLAVRLPSGQWVCDDDTWGLNPAVTLTAAEAGEYRILVGAFAPGTETEFTLFAAPGDPVWTPDEWSAGADSGQTFLNAPTSVDDLGVREPPGSGMITIEGRPTEYAGSLQSVPFAGDDVAVPALQLGDACVGFINPARPDVVVRLGTEAEYLAILTESSNDTTLVVVDPLGEIHCNDDFTGLDAGLEWIDAPAGDYAVWVGEFSGEIGSATVTAVVENPGQRLTLGDWIRGDSPPDAMPSIRELPESFRVVLDRLVRDWSLEAVFIEAPVTLRTGVDALEIEFPALRVSGGFDLPDVLLANVALELRTLSPDEVHLALDLGRSITVIDSGSPIARIDIGQQDMTGVMNLTLGEFTLLDLVLGEITAASLPGLGEAGLGQAMGDSVRALIGQVSLNLDNRQGTTSPDHRNGDLRLEMEDFGLSVEGEGGLLLNRFVMTQSVREIDAGLVELFESWAIMQDRSRILENLIRHGNSLDRLLNMVDAFSAGLQVEGLEVWSEDASGDFRLGSAGFGFDVSGLASDRIHIQMRGAFGDFELDGSDWSHDIDIPVASALQLEIENIPGARVWLNAIPILLMDSSYLESIIRNSGLAIRVSGDSRAADGSSTLDVRVAADPDSVLGLTFSLLLEEQGRSWLDGVLQEMEKDLLRDVPGWLSDRIRNLDPDARIFIQLDKRGDLTISRRALQVLMALSQR
jgi:hypothetical protein